MKEQCLVGDKGLRMWRSKLRVRDTQFSSKAYGTHDWKEISIDGRVQLDLLMAIQRDHKLSRQAPGGGCKGGLFVSVLLLRRATCLVTCTMGRAAACSKQCTRTS